MPGKAYGGQFRLWFSPAHTLERAASTFPPTSMGILNQLGELFVQAIPTVLMVFLFYLFLRRNFFKPLEAILNERKARTEGARLAAEATQAAAREKARSYEEALKKARAVIYSEQESARRQLLEERTALIQTARSEAGEMIRAAKEGIAIEFRSAQTALEQESDALAEEIARTILERRPPGMRARSEAR